MTDKTLLALALLLALSLPGLATAAGDPLRLSAPAAGEPAPRALCAAAPATATPQGLPPSLARELSVGADALICSSSCGYPVCHGASPGDACARGGGYCNMTAE